MSDRKLYVKIEWDKDDKSLNGARYIVKKTVNMHFPIVGDVIDTKTLEELREFADVTVSV